MCESQCKKSARSCTTFLHLVAVNFHSIFDFYVRRVLLFRLSHRPTKDLQFGVRGSNLGSFVLIALRFHCVIYNVY